MNTGPLRGIVHHVLPAMRRIRQYHEDRWGAGSYTPPRTVGFGLWQRRGEIWSRPDVERGACLWCLRPHHEKSRKGNPLRAYCRPCKRMKDYFAIGSARPAGSVLGFNRCAKCGAGSHCRIDRPRRLRNRIWDTEQNRMVMVDIGIGLELDHRVALSIAYTVAGLEGWVRALLPGNLQWLCADCHREKTTEDMRTLAALRKIDRGEIIKELDRRRRTDPTQISLPL